MGQSVEIRGSSTIGEALIVDTDRSLTGQDGRAPAPDAEGADAPGLLAKRLYGLGLGIDRVFVLQNVVTVSRQGGWDEGAAGRVADATKTFLNFYSEGE